MDWIFVIVRAIPLYTTFYIVSIHLMLLFIIKMQLKKVIEYYGFNTSHITLYQIWESSCNRNTNVSIHLMLLFIGLLQSNSEPHSPFQYISCYSLSVTGNTYGAKDVRFNTSHVTLYRKTIQYPQYPFCRFQYISCYSLSIPEDVQDKIKKLFQYISCYSLSKISRP